MTVGTEAFQRHHSAVRARLLRSGHVRPGADSITWKINREMIVVAGWGRAILMQLAHPSIAAGVHDHSAFRSCPFSKLRRVRSTVRAMLSLTFGDAAHVVETAAGINTIHDRVWGQVGQNTYSAHDPELQRWVHATLLDSIPLIYERLVGPLTLRERDRYYSEASIMEPLLGMPAGWLPRDSAQLDAYMREMLSSGRLVVTDTSRTLARAVLYPRVRYAVWPVFRAVQLLTIGSLPPAIRDAYGFEWRPRDERALARWTTGLRVSLRMLPPAARQWRMARREVNLRHGKESLAESTYVDGGAADPAGPVHHGAVHLRRPDDRTHPSGPEGGGLRDVFGAAVPVEPGG